MKKKGTIFENSRQKGEKKKMNTVKKEYIKTAVDEWDPIELLPFAPPDEYDFETEKIYNYVKRKNTVGYQYLAEIVYRVFQESFGEDVFDKTMEDCRIVANKILQLSGINKHSINETSQGIL